MRLRNAFGGAIFFGTPFQGIDEWAKAWLLANLMQLVGNAVPSQMLQFLDPENESLAKLREDLVQMAEEEPKARIAYIYEQTPTNYLAEAVPKKLKNMVAGYTRRSSSIVVTKESASLPIAFDTQGWRVDHRQLNRFDRGGKDTDEANSATGCSTANGRYAVMKGLLKKVVTDAHMTVKKRLSILKQSDLDEEIFNRLSESLWQVNFARQLAAAESLSGDGRWILRDDTFKAWSQWPPVDADGKSDRQSDASLLWLSGSEGLGKTKAAAAAVKHLSGPIINSDQDGADSTIVAYFFCDSSPETNTAEVILKTLIWQLVLKQRALGQHATGLAAGPKSGALSSQPPIKLAELWHTLQAMLADPNVSKVYFVLNNVHCLSREGANKAVTAEFWELIRTKISNASSTDAITSPLISKTKWIISSSGDYDDIKYAIEPRDGNNPYTVWINLEDGSRTNTLRDITKAYTRDEVAKLAKSQRYSLGLQYFVTNALQRRAGTNKLWVEVICLLLAGLSSSHEKVRQTLENVDQDVGELINTAWTEALDAKNENINTFKEILRTLVVLYNDPTIAELQVLAGLARTETYTIWKQLKACGPLLRIYDDNNSEWSRWGDYYGSLRVGFIHDVARRALMSQETSRKLIGLSRLQSDMTEIQWQHGVVALRCFSYTVGHDVHDGDEYEDEENFTPADEQADKDIDIIDNLFPADLYNTDTPDGDQDLLDLEYPVQYWMRRASDATAFVDTMDLKHAFWRRDSHIRKRWWDSYAISAGLDGLTGLSALHVAAYFGLVPLVKLLLKDKLHREEIRDMDSWRCQPLHWASYQGHDQIAKLLLDAQADVCAGSRTALHMAASGGKSGTMELLLTRGSHIDAMAMDGQAHQGPGQTPLAWAISHNQVDAARLLLSRNANSTLRSGSAPAPLALAAAANQVDIVAELTQRPVPLLDVASALVNGASVGNIAIVENLLRLHDRDNVTALESALVAAATSGFHLLVRTLLNSGHSRPIDSDSGLKAAASCGKDATIREIYQYYLKSHQEQQPECCKIYMDGMNAALYHATDEMHESTVECLLSLQASPDAVGVPYENALTASAHDGTTAILGILLKKGANINASCGWPLEAAAAHGHFIAVEVLLAANPPINVNASSSVSPNGTALQAACVAGRTDIAKLLLDHGADPNVGGGVYDNPLTASVANYNGPLMDLLLDRDANPNVCGGPDKRTPLINAATNLHVDYMQRLIDHGAQVNSTDTKGNTAMIMAAYCGDDDCVKLLKKHGANVNAPGGEDHGSALHASAAQGHTETCNLLLQLGASLHSRGGPFDTVIQAAASSGNSECITKILEFKMWTGVDLEVRGGKYFTALHAAAVQYDRCSLDVLLKRRPTIDVVSQAPVNMGQTPLEAAIRAGRNGNARLLLEAGAKSDIVTAQYGTMLQIAALRCSVELCELLVKKNPKARLDSLRNARYGSALEAAVVRDYHEGSSNGAMVDSSVLDFLLAKCLSPGAYENALKRALHLRRKEAFKKIWERTKVLAPKMLRLSCSPQNLLLSFQSEVWMRDKRTIEHEKGNPDFNEDMVDYPQDFNYYLFDRAEHIPQSLGQSSLREDGNMYDSTQQSGLKSAYEVSGNDIARGSNNSNDAEYDDGSDDAGYDEDTSAEAGVSRGNDAVYDEGYNSQTGGIDFNVDTNVAAGPDELTYEDGIDDQNDADHDEADQYGAVQDDTDQGEAVQERVGQDEAKQNGSEDEAVQDSQPNVDQEPSLDQETLVYDDTSRNVDTCQDASAGLDMQERQTASFAESESLAAQAVDAVAYNGFPKYIAGDSGTAKWMVDGAVGGYDDHEPATGVYFPSCSDGDEVVTTLAQDSWSSLQVSTEASTSAQNGSAVYDTVSPPPLPIPHAIIEAELPPLSQIPLRPVAAQASSSAPQVMTKASTHTDGPEAAEPVRSHRSSRFMSALGGFAKESSRKLEHMDLDKVSSNMNKVSRIALQTLVLVDTAERIENKIENAMGDGLGPNGYAYQ